MRFHGIGKRSIDLRIIYRNKSANFRVAQQSRHNLHSSECAIIDNCLPRDIGHVLAFKTVKGAEILSDIN